MLFKGNYGGSSIFATFSAVNTMNSSMHINPIFTFKRMVTKASQSRSFLWKAMKSLLYLSCKCSLLTHPRELLIEFSTIKATADKM